MKPNISRALAGGLAGTAAMTFIMYAVAPMMGMMKMDIAASLGQMLGGSWALGMMMHFVNGSVIFPLMFALALHRILPGSAAVKGVVWGGVLWLLAQTLVVPMMGGGFFSANAGGASAAMGSLAGHVIYGAILGAIAGLPARHQAPAARPGVRAA